MSFTNGEVMNVAALGLVVGTLFFTTFGIATERDFFLLLGLLTTTIGDAGFAAFLWGEAPEKNDEHAVFFCCLSALSAFGVYAQFQKYREEGCGYDDDDVEDAVSAADEVAAAAAEASERPDADAHTAASLLVRRRKKTG